MLNKKILFYSSVSDKKLFQLTGFYSTDISILQELGYDVFLSNSYKDFLYFWKYDIAFIYFWTRGVIPAIISKIFGKKVIFTGGVDSLDKIYNKSKKNYLIKKILFKLCTMFSDANIIVSESDLKNIAATNYKIKNIFLIPHVIDFEKYKYDGTPKENMITTIAWMEAKSNVCRKGVDKLLYVFKEFLEYGNNFELVIIGTLGAGADYLKEIAKKIGIIEKISFTGSIDEKEKIVYLKKSKIYCQLSEYEGFGIAVLEALASGNIVVHSGKGGLSSTLKSFAVKVDDIENYKNIAGLLHELNSNYEQYSNLIKQGMIHIENNFHHDVRKRELNKIISEFDIKNKKKP